MNIKPCYKSINDDLTFVKQQNAVNAFLAENPRAEIIDLGIGDLKLPPVKAVSRALKKGACLITRRKTFKGYSPDFGYSFLREKISLDYKKAGEEVMPDEIFITDGAKGAIGALFDVIAAKNALILSPAYPLYKDLCLAYGVNVRFACGKSFCEFPLPPEDFSPDLIFICSPNNPTGGVISDELFEKYVDYALKCGALIVFDSAYYDFARVKNRPFASSGAGACVAEVRSYSKGLSFTGLRCGFIALKRENPAYKAYKRRELLHSNGVNFISQYAAAASYENSAIKQAKERVEFYRCNARVISAYLTACGANFCGGFDAPYILLKTPCCGEKFAAKLLYEKGVVVTPGEGFGAENYVRISVFCSRKQAAAAGQKIAEFYAERKL